MISPALRHFVYRTSLGGPAKTLSHHYYQTVSKICLRRLGQVPGVVNVSLRGGSLTLCQPGISDLDFTIIVDKLCPGEPSLRNLRQTQKTLRHLKQVFKIPGEAVLMDERDWALLEKSAVGPRVLQAHRRIWRENRWRDLVDPSFSQLTGGPKFYFCFQFYIRALAYLRTALRNNCAYSKLRFQKEIAKVFRYSGFIPDSQLSEIGQLGPLFSQLDALARDMSPDFAGDSNGELPLSELARDQFSKVAGRGRRFSASAIPFLFFAEDFCFQSDWWENEWVAYLRRVHAPEILLATPAINSRLVEGWSWWPAIFQWGRLLAGRTELSEACCGRAASAFAHRVLEGYFHILGYALWGPSEGLREFSWNLLVAAYLESDAGLVKEITAVREWARPCYPNAVAATETSPAAGDLRLQLGVREEAYRFLMNVAKPN